MDWGNYAQWAGASATFLAVLVALFREPFVRWRRRPILDIKGVMGPPHSHKIPLTYLFQLTSQTFGEVASFHFRLWIENEGKTRAEQVQVLAARLSRRTDNGSFKVDNDFLPMNLKWSHSHEIYLQGISPRMGRHCDLGHVIEPSQRAGFKEDLPGVATTNTIFTLALEAAPTSLTHLLKQGIYRLELRVASANGTPVTKVLEIVHSGNWYDDEEKMFRDGISVRVVD